MPAVQLPACVFSATIRATIDPETGERGVFATQQFDEVVKAEKYAQLESHGVEGAHWEITAELPVRRAINVVKASRNRAIGVYLSAPGALVGAYHYLKAPLTCEVLETLYPNGGTVQVRINANMLFVG